MTKFINTFLEFEFTKREFFKCKKSGLHKHLNILLFDETKWTPKIIHQQHLRISLLIQKHRGTRSMA